MQALIFREIGHIWHKNLRESLSRGPAEGENSLAQLYQEGLAMVYEHILCQDDRYYHQNQNGWLDWCKENEAEIKREYLLTRRQKYQHAGFLRGLAATKNHSDVGLLSGLRVRQIFAAAILACRYSKPQCQSVI